jgi:hypothetical protein
MLHTHKVSQTKKISFVAGLVLTVAALFGTATVAVSKVAAADCDSSSNAIIYCGFSSPSNFISKVRGNDSGNGHHDLQSVYSFYGLNAADYDAFAAHAVAGKAYKDGRIVVGNKTVATAGKSIGREAAPQGSGYFAQNIAGHTYYGNTNGKAFASDSLPVYVLFDSQGNMKFAVIQSCGNPEFGTVVHSSASCNSLQKTAVAGELNTYNFTASASVSGNDTITKYVYNFGDGSPTVTMTNGSTPVKHTYTKAGTFTASVTVYASVPGNSNLQLPSVSMCTKVITVKIPFYNCDSLAGAILDKDKFTYSFTAKANFGNGATLTSGDFTFGDGKSQAGVKANGTAVIVSHTYAEAGTYNIAATLHFSVSGKDVTAPTCTAVVTPTTPPTPTCKPGVPVGSPECVPPCQPGSNVPPESEQCKPPELPNTGAGNVIAIFAAVAIGGFLVWRQVIFRRHKAAFAAAERGTSPLPLGDPLGDQPLANTPLAKTRRTFRRKRPF